MRRGEKPADKALGLDVPLPLLGRADEVIEYDVPRTSFAAVAHGRFWHEAAVQACPHLSPLPGVKRTRFARFELYRV